MTFSSVIAREGAPVGGDPHTVWSREGVRSLGKGCDMEIRTGPDGHLEAVLRGRLTDFVLLKRAEPAAGTRERA